MEEFFGPRPDRLASRAVAYGAPTISRAATSVAAELTGAVRRAPGTRRSSGASLVALAAAVTAPGARRKSSLLVPPVLEVPLIKARVMCIGQLVMTLLASLVPG